MQLPLSVTGLNSIYRCTVYNLHNVSTQILRSISPFIFLSFWYSVKDSFLNLIIDIYVRLPNTFWSWWILIGGRERYCYYQNVGWEIKSLWELKKLRACLVWENIIIFSVFIFNNKKTTTCFHFVAFFQLSIPEIWNKKRFLKPNRL
jgi:hypothetical protein